MIRINLLGQGRPKARRPPVPVGATLPVFLGLAALVVALGFLYYHWMQIGKEIDEQNAAIARDSAEKARLELVKQEVERFEREKPILEHRKNVIDQLRRDRTGGQELLDVVATTVTRTDSLWLTALTRKENALNIDGTAASINAVANFITQLKRSGYFDRVEIKEAKQDERTAVQTFNFSLTADFVLPTTQAQAAPAPRKS